MLSFSTWARRVLVNGASSPDSAKPSGSESTITKEGFVEAAKELSSKPVPKTEFKAAEEYKGTSVENPDTVLQTETPDNLAKPKSKIDDLKKNLGLKTGAEIPAPEKPAESVYEAFEKFTLDKEEPYFEEHPSPMEFEATACISKVKILDTNKYLNSGGLVRFNYKGETYEMNISEDVYVALVKDGDTWMKVIGQGNTWNAKGYITATKK